MPFKKEHLIKTIYPAAAVAGAAATTGTALVINTSGIYPCHLTAITGPVYFTTLTTSPLTSNSITVATSNYWDFRSGPNGYVALYSTSTGGVYELVVFQE